MLSAIVRNDRAAIERHARRRDAVLVVAVLGVAAGSFSNSLLVAALPRVAADLHTTTSVVSWVNIAPAIAFAVSMPIFGKLGDLYGHRRVFLIGWSVATVLAFATAAAPNAYWLIGLRTAAQLAGTSTTPASYGILASVYPQEDRARVFGLTLAVLALSPVIAITFGGPAIDAVGWRSLFVAQGMVASVAVAIAIPVLPETPRRKDVRFDVPGALLATVGLVSLLLAINRAPEWGLDHRGVQAAFVIGVVGLWLFVRVERRARDPLVQLNWLARREVAAPIITNFAAHAAFLGLVVTAPFLVRNVFGYSGTVTAWLTGLRPAFYAVGAFSCSHVTRRLGERRVQFLGNTMVAASGVLTYFGAHTHSIGLIIANFVVGGFGLGIGRPAVIAAVNNSVSNADSGIANGLYSTSQMLGSSIGQTTLVAMVGTSVAASAYANAALGAALLGVGTVVCCSFIRFNNVGALPADTADVSG